MNQRWTIEQLAIVVEKALETAKYDGQQSARVRTVPDLRTIRYYTTLGLIDPPIEMRGRKAFYGPRHVLQLVAIKRIQARSLPLAEIQKALAGVDDRALADLARVPADFWTAVANALPTTSGPAISDEAEPTPRREGFWAAMPEASPASQQVSSGPVRARQAFPAIHFAVAEGATLVIEGIDPARLDAATLAGLSPVLDKLAKSLRQLGLRSNGTAAFLNSHHRPSRDQGK
jgi:DNA-binding transcriptional MerR regulator